MSILHPEALLKYIYWLEHVVPVNDFAIGDFHVWPIVRIHLSAALQNVDACSDAEIFGDRYWKALVERIEQSFQGCVGEAAGRPDGDPDCGEIPVDLFSSSLSAAAAVPATHDALFFTRASEHFVKTEAGYCAPVLDPWIDAFRGSRRTLKIEVLDTESMQRMPRRHTTLLLPPVRPCGAVRQLEEDLCRQVEALCNVVIDRSRQLGMGLGALVDGARRDLVIAFSAKLVFDEFFRSIRPRVVFLSCYYHPWAFGLLWSAREAGIPTVEVQHGANGDHHLGYTHWSRLPERGYHVLPRVFLVWGAGSANNLSRWFPAGHTFHRVVIGGKPAVRVGDELERAGREELFARRAGRTKTVLVTLQNTPGTGLNALLLELMRSSAPKNWLWLVRGHPMAPESQPTEDGITETERTLASLTGVSWEYRLATRMSLDALLPLCDHHVTNFSGAVYDAMRHGVPTTFVNPGAFSFHGSLIHRCLAHYAASSGSALASIAAGRDGLDWEQVGREVIDDPARVEGLIAALPGCDAAVAVSGFPAPPSE